MATLTSVLVGVCGLPYPINAPAALGRARRVHDHRNTSRTRRHGIDHRTAAIHQLVSGTHSETSANGPVPVLAGCHDVRAVLNFRPEGSRTLRRWPNTPQPFTRLNACRWLTTSQPFTRLRPNPRGASRPGLGQHTSCCRRFLRRTPPGAKGGPWREPWALHRPRPASSFHLNSRDPSHQDLALSPAADPAAADLTQEPPLSLPKSTLPKSTRRLA